MKEKPLSLWSEGQSAYVEMMAAEVRKQCKPTKILPADMDPAERRKAILALQSPSTRRTLERDPSQDEAWLARPIPYEQAQVAKSPEEMAKYERPITPEEFNLVEGVRRRPKNSTGQSELSAFTQEGRTRAISAFTCSPPAELTAQERERISQIAPYTPPPPLPPVEAKPSLFARILAWFKPMKSKSRHGLIDGEGFIIHED